MTEIICWPFLHKSCSSLMHLDLWFIPAQASATTFPSNCGCRTHTLTLTLMGFCITNWWFTECMLITQRSWVSQVNLSPQHIYQFCCAWSSVRLSSLHQTSLFTAAVYYKKIWVPHPIQGLLNEDNRLFNKQPQCQLHMSTGLKTVFGL